MVSTWYGGILGVGEYSWRHGVSTWLVFGLPYYLAAVLFALALASRLRRSQAVSIPELLRSAYGPAAARTGAVAVLALALPVANVLMVASLLSRLTGWPLAASAFVAAAFSALYLSISGFRAVVRTDALQFALMYAAFLVLLPAAVHHVGGLGALWDALPPGHRSPDGGLGWQAVAVWYLIALQTVVDPAFYQRVFAARTPAVARSGVLVSVVLWAGFDFMTTFSGLAARLVAPDLADPMAAYPTLAAAVLPPWLAALFGLGLFATVMSAVDSYLFLAAATLSHDLLPAASPEAERRRTRLGLAAAAALPAAGALLFDSAVVVWHHVGSVVTAALLLPVVAVHLPARLRPRPGFALAAMVSSAATAVAWIALAGEGRYPLGLEPVFPALSASLLCWLADLAARARPAQRYNPPRDDARHPSP